MSQQEVSTEVQKIWALFREIAKRQEETGNLIREVAKRQEEAGNQIREAAKRQEEAGIQIEKVARRQEEAGIQIKEVAKQQEGNDSKFKDLRELFTGQWGKLVEALVEPSVLSLFQARGIQVIDTAQRLKTTRQPPAPFGKGDGEQMEIDILATNKDNVIVVEVKTTLKVEDVNDFIIEKLSRFFEFFPKYKGMKLYGAVAGIRIEEESDKYAYRKGLFVLTLSGEGMVVILNDEKFRPKQW